MIRTVAAILLCTLATACDAHYSTLGFRPVDTTSQLVLGDVHVLVSHDHAQPREEGVTDDHGGLKLSNLRAGDMIIFSYPGFDKAILTLGVGGYHQRSPEGAPDDVWFFIGDDATIPVPLHRSGHVEKPLPLR
jgi:hypothetical protein